MTIQAPGTLPHRPRFRPGPEGWRRLDIVLRVLAGVAGGYGLAALFTMVLSTGLPMARVEAVLAASMASFAIFTAAVVWAFAARSAARAWIGITIPAALLGLALLLQGTRA